MNPQTQIFPGKLMRLALPGLAFIAASVQADATLVYQTVDSKGETTRHTFAISGRFVRVDADTDPDRYRVIDAGMLTMATVDEASRRYTFEQLPRGVPPSTAPAGKPEAAEKGAKEPVAEQGAGAIAHLSPQPELVPTRKKENVVGIICRVVNEVANDRTVGQHCMAGTGPLGLNTREMITLSRLFTLARRMELGWAGVATADERIASVDSHLADGASAQTLLSVSHEDIPDARFQITKNYKRVKSLKEAVSTQAADSSSGKESTVE